jgi:hypothetical protein
VADNVSFKPTDDVPKYVNNARITLTEENAFLDLGLADPFEAEKGADLTSQVQVRVVMNKSTFLTLGEHINELSIQLQQEPRVPFPVTVMSRCPAHREQGGPQ